MRNPTGKKLEKLIFGIFDDASQGVDRYNHNDSLWLIFTNEMKWVVEFTKDQTLWYNYNFFKDEMDLIGLNCATGPTEMSEHLRYLSKNAKIAISVIYINSTNNLI